MSGFKLVKSATYSLTAELAREFRDMKASPTERPTKPARLKMLRDKAEGGNLVSFHWAKAMFNGEWVRVNGQHSSIMLGGLDSFPKGLFAHIDEYEIDDTDGLATLFRQFDDPKSARNTAEVAGAWQGLVTALAECPRQVAKEGIDGIWWYQTSLQGAVPSSDGTPISKEDRYSLFNRKEYHPFLLWLGQTMSIKTPEFRHPATIAAIYATFQANSVAAREFWESVARGGPQFEDGAPATLLDEWLKRASDKASKDANMKPGNFYQACIFAWNAYREGAMPKSIKSDWKKGFLSVTE